MKQNQVHLRWFEKQDIPLKVKWINNAEINKFLHYDIPLSVDRTYNWFQRVINNDSRMDFIIEVTEDNHVYPVGLIGLIDIDTKNLKGEFYIALGDKSFFGKGIGYIASAKFIDYSFKKYNLNKIYLYTEKGNHGAQKLFEKIGFIKEGLLKEDLIYMGKKVDRYVYSLFRKDFYNGKNSIV